MRDRQLNSWKPPMAWQCPLDKSETPETSSSKSLELPVKPEEKRAILTKGQEYPPMEISYLRRLTGKMESASQNTVLLRLKEGSVGADASVTLRSEGEKLYWMLTALRRQAVSSSDCGTADSPASKPARVLSLYENHGTPQTLAHSQMLIRLACSSFLSVHTSATELHHLSTTPLSPEYYPNVCPLSGLLMSGYTDKGPLFSAPVFGLMYLPDIRFLLDQDRRRRGVGAKIVKSIRMKTRMRS